LRKKIPRPRSGQGRFFSSKPAGPGLDSLPGIQKFACEKASEEKLEKLKTHRKALTTAAGDDGHQAIAAQMP